MTVDHLRYDKNHEEYLRVGRNFLDDLTRSMALSGIGVGHNTLDLPDGTRIIVSSRNGGNDTEIIPPIELPVVPEEKKREEEEEEEITPFLAVGAKIISGPNINAAVYLYVVEPESEDSDDEDRIIGYRDNPEDSNYVEATITIPELNTTDGSYGPVTNTTAKSNPHGACGYYPQDGDALSGYKSAIIVWGQMQVTDEESGDEISPDIIAGEYAIKVCLDSSCDAESWVLELKILCGIDEDGHVVTERTETVDISWNEDEIGDNWQRLVTPFGINKDGNGDIVDEQTMEENYLPPSCWDWDTERFYNGPPDGEYGPNPHVNNYWQGAFLCGLTTGSVRTDSEYVPDIGYDLGSLMEGSNKFADRPICGECDYVPSVYVSRVWFEFSADFDEDGDYTYWSDPDWGKDVGVFKNDFHPWTEDEAKKQIAWGLYGGDYYDSDTSERYGPGFDLVSALIGGCTTYPYFSASTVIYNLQEGPPYYDGPPMALSSIIGSGPLSEVLRIEVRIGGEWNAEYDQCWGLRQGAITQWGPNVSAFFEGYAACHQDPHYNLLIFGFNSWSGHFHVIHTSREGGTILAAFAPGPNQAVSDPFLDSRMDLVAPNCREDRFSFSELPGPYKDAIRDYFYQEGEE